MDHDPQLHTSVDRPVHNELRTMMSELGSVAGLLSAIDIAVKSNQHYQPNALQLARMARLMTHPEELHMDLPLSQDESAFYVGSLIALKANEMILGGNNSNEVYKNINAQFIAAQRVVHNEQRPVGKVLDPLKNRIQIASYLLSELTDADDEPHMHDEELDLITEWADTLIPGEQQLQAEIINGYAFVRHAVKAQDTTSKVFRSAVSQDANSIQPDVDSSFIELMHGVEIDEDGVHELRELEKFATNVNAELNNFLHTHKNVVIQSDEQEKRLLAEASQYVEAYLDEVLGLKVGDDIVGYGEAALIFYRDDLSKIGSMYPITSHSRVRGRINAIIVKLMPQERAMKSFVQNYKRYIESGESMIFKRTHMVLGVELLLDDTTIFELGGRTVLPDSDEVTALPLYEFAGSIMKIIKSS